MLSGLLLTLEPSGVDGGYPQCSLFQYIQQDLDRIQCCEHCHIVFRSVFSYEIAVVGRSGRSYVAGVDHIGYMALTDGSFYFVAALADLFLRTLVLIPFSLRNLAVPAVASILKPRS